MVKLNKIRWGLVSAFLLFFILGCVLAANENEILRIQKLYSNVAAALDESETAIILLDNNNIIGWNAGAKRLFDVDQDEALEKNISEFIDSKNLDLSTFIPSDKQKTVALFCEIKTASEVKNSIMFLKPIPNKEDAYMLIIAAGVGDVNIKCLDNF